MTFQDIFKSSFLENITSVSLLDMLVALILALGIGMFIFLIYKKTYQGVMYEEEQHCADKDAAQYRQRNHSCRQYNSYCDRPKQKGNIQGLLNYSTKTYNRQGTDHTQREYYVGGDGQDDNSGDHGQRDQCGTKTGGIHHALICFFIDEKDTGMIPLAILGSIFIGTVLLLFVNKKSHRNPYIVVLSCADSAAEAQAKAFLEKHVLKSVVKSKTAQKGMIELNMH